MLILEIIKYLLRFTLISSIQIFSFIYYVIKAKSIEERVLALREGLTSVAYLTGIFTIIFGKWEIGILVSVLSIAYANYFIHEDSREVKQKKSTC